MNILADIPSNILRDSARRAQLRAEMLRRMDRPPEEIAEAEEIAHRLRQEADLRPFEPPPRDEYDELLRRSDFVPNFGAGVIVMLLIFALSFGVVALLGGTF
jgi:hypothetical protein